MPVQSVLFGLHWSVDAARAWLALHGFKATGKVHRTAHNLRFRQYAPKSGERYVTKTLPNHSGVKLIVSVHGPPRLAR